MQAWTLQSFTVLLLLSFCVVGTILSSIILVFSLGLNYLTCYWLFETQARAVQQTYVRSKAVAENVENLDTLDSAGDALLSNESENTLASESGKGAVMDIIDLPNPLNCWVTLEVVELVDIFLGKYLNAVVGLALAHSLLTSPRSVRLLFGLQALYGE